MVSACVRVERVRIDRIVSRAKLLIKVNFIPIQSEIKFWRKIRTIAVIARLYLPRCSLWSLMFYMLCSSAARSYSIFVMILCS